MLKKTQHQIRDLALIAGMTATTVMTPVTALANNANVNHGQHVVIKTTLLYNKHHKLIKTIKKGTPVTVVKTAGTKTYVKVDHKTGYVLTKFLRYKAAQKTVYQLSLKRPTALKTKAKVNAKAVVKLGVHTPIKLDQPKTNTKWLKVKARKLTGYVLAKDVTIKKTHVAAKPTVATSYANKPLTSAAHSLSSSNQAHVDQIAKRLNAINQTTPSATVSVKAPGVSATIGPNGVTTSVNDHQPTIVKSATPKQNSSVQSSAVTSLKAAVSQLSSASNAVSSAAKKTNDKVVKSNASVVADHIAAQVKADKLAISAIPKDSHYANSVASGQYQQLVAQKAGISNANVAIKAQKTIDSLKPVVKSNVAEQQKAVAKKDSSAAKLYATVASSAQTALDSATQAKQTAQTQLDLSYRDAFGDEDLATESLNSEIAQIFTPQATLGDDSASNAVTTKIGDDNTDSTGQMSTGDNNANSNYLSNSDHAGWSSYDSDTASKAAFDNQIFDNKSDANKAIASANAAMLQSLAVAHGGQPTVTKTASNAIYVYPDGTVNTLVLDVTGTDSTSANDSLHSTMASAANSAALASMTALHGSYQTTSQPDQTTYRFADGYIYQRENDLNWLQQSTASSSTDITGVTVVTSGSTAKLSAVATSNARTDNPVYEQAMIDAHGSEYTVDIGGIIYQSYADGTKVAVYDNRANVAHSNADDSANFASFAVPSASSNASNSANSASNASGSGSTSTDRSINPTPSGISNDQLASVEAARLASLASAEAKNGIANPFVKRNDQTNSNTMGSNGLYDSAAVNKVYNSLTDGATQINFDTSTADKTDHNQADYNVSAHSTASNVDANSAHSLNPREIDSSASTSMASSEAVFYSSEMAVMHSNSVAIDSTQVSINSMVHSAAKSYQAVQSTADSYNHDLASATNHLTDVRNQYQSADSTAISYAIDADKASQSNETTKASDDTSHASSWAAVRDALASPLSDAINQVNTLTDQTNSAESTAIASSDQANSLSTSLNTLMSSETSSLEQSNTYMSYFAAKQAEIYNAFARTDPHNSQLASASAIAASYAKSVTDGSVATSLAASKASADSVAASKAIVNANYAASMSAEMTSIATALSTADSLAASIAAENDYNFRSGATDSYNAIINSMTDSVNADLQNIDADAIKGEIQSYADSAHALAPNLDVASSAINDMGNRMEHAVQSEMTKSMNAAEPRNVDQN